MGQITAIQSKADAAFYALLTPAQPTTLNASPGALDGMGFGDRDSEVPVRADRRRARHLEVQASRRVS